MQNEWMRCPLPGKTRKRIREGAVKSHPLYRPKRKQETLTGAEDLPFAVIQKQESRSLYVRRRIWRYPYAAVFLRLSADSVKGFFVASAVCPAPSPRPGSMHQWGG